MKIDMKRDDVSGALAILEVNARFNLWHHLGAAAGINLPQIAYRDLIGEDLPPTAVDYATDVRWLAFGDDVRTFLRSYRPAGLGWIDWLTSLAKGRRVFDVFDWDDPLPWASTIVQRFARGRS
jgi:predicted ATP-grasp superfamily ATP-dependent carboligase